MSLRPGSNIGPYFVDREIGRGGMGVVYLARDPRLQRDVAIKALPDHLADDSARLDRFRSEAQALAQLNHPNIAGIHGVEEQDGASYLVLEYVEGETLSDRLARAPMGVDEAIELGVQIAAGVEAAHEAGVVHRDLKPDNIRLTVEGDVKILDFGLAKVGDATSSSSGLSETVAAPAQHSPTMPGMILGTAAYMSPEQARGRGVDRRTDVWAFGVVLYECLTGASPFAGENAGDSIGAVLHKDVDFERLPAETPTHVRRVLARCLQRDKAKRLRDMGDVRIELEYADDVAVAAPSSKTSKLIMIVAVVLAAVSTAGFVVTALRSSTPVSTASNRLSIQLPGGMEVIGPVDISDDGRRVAFSGHTDGEQWVYVRDLGGFELQRIEGSRDGLHPRFSPDGESILFHANGAIHRARIRGGAPARIVRAKWMTADWDEDGAILYSFGLNSPLLRLPAGGGVAEPITDLETDGAYAHVWPERATGTDKVLFTAWGGDGQSGAQILDLATGQWRSLEAAGGVGSFTAPARWSPTGHLIFERWDAGLWALPFDPTSDATVSAADAVPLLADVFHMGNATRSVYALSDEGTLVYAPGAPSRGRTLVWIDEDGVVTPIVAQSDYAATGLGGKISISPDGTKVLTGAGGNILEVDLIRNLGRQVTFVSANVLRPIHFPDGERFVFSSNQNERWSLWVSGLGASATSEMLLQRDLSIYAEDVSIDGTILFRETSPETGSDLYVLTPDGEVRALVKTASDEEDPDFSVDGRWVAYMSNISGRDEVYLTGVDGTASPVQVSSGGGESPRFGPSGETLYFRRHREMFRVGFRDGQPVGEPVRVFDAPNLAATTAYDFDADESRILTVQLADEAIPRELRVITNFFDVIEEAMTGEAR